MSGQGNPKRTVMTVAGMALVVYGLYRLIGQVSYTWWPAFSQVVVKVMRIVWPIAILVAGLALIVLASNGKTPLSSGRKLYRKRSGRVLGGVCAGLADYSGLDVTTVRLISVVLMVASFSLFVLLYVVLWVIVPEEPQDGSVWV